MLPPVVIQRGDRFLGPNGWTPVRREALSFDFEAQARDWMINCPAEMVIAAAVARVPMEPENPGQPIPMRHDFDPSEGA